YRPVTPGVAGSSPVRCAISASRPTERLEAQGKPLAHLDPIAKTLVERPGFFVSGVWKKPHLLRYHQRSLSANGRQIISILSAVFAFLCQKISMWLFAAGAETFKVNPSVNFALSSWPFDSSRKASASLQIRCT
ncbi:hypothetical protein, partial [Pseudomonas sp.]|uniref:hypothetical protein n=1 Tax=Pseudomonas sp. TaxID=306 RepID=UPI002655D5CD|nr:hypothetical protein [Pseudomonadales bacterium]